MGCKCSWLIAEASFPQSGVWGYIVFLLTGTHPCQIATGIAFHLQGEDFTLTLEITAVPDEELVQKSQHGVAHRFQLLVDLRSLNLNLL